MTTLAVVPRLFEQVILGNLDLVNDTYHILLLNDTAEIPSNFYTVTNLLSSQINPTGDYVAGGAVAPNITAGYNVFEKITDVIMEDIVLSNLTGSVKYMVVYKKGTTGAYTDLPLFVITYATPETFVGSNMDQEMPPYLMRL